MVLEFRAVFRVKAFLKRDKLFDALTREEAAGIRAPDGVKTTAYPRFTPRVANAVNNNRNQETGITLATGAQGWRKEFKDYTIRDYEELMKGSPLPLTLQHQIQPSSQLFAETVSVPPKQEPKEEPKHKLPKIRGPVQGV